MFHRLWSKVLELFSRYATEPTDSEEWRIKKMIGIVTIVGGTLTYVAYCLLYLTSGERAAGFAAMGAAALFAGGLVTYGFFRHYGLHWHLWMVAHVMGISLIHLFLGGFAPGGMVIVWVLATPIETLVVYKPRQGLAWFLVISVLFIAAALLQPVYLRPTNNLQPGIVTALYVFNVLGVSTYMLLAVYYYLWRNAILSQLLAQEQEKAEALLLNVLPEEIATILKNENRVIADHFEGASILFADVVNFTPMSAKMTPIELVELLNEVFSYFDSLVEKYGLEKIKTIGDCYMVAAGVPRPRADHAHVLTLLAIEMRDYVHQHEFRGKRLTFRIGLNSGPVVAGVIGRKKFIYDLWGDAVNTASRMESHGMEGFIQVTEATYELIKDDFTCEPRGVVSVKGKGEMNVWYVQGEKGCLSVAAG